MTVGKLVDTGQRPLGQWPAVAATILHPGREPVDGVFSVAKTIDEEECVKAFAFPISSKEPMWLTRRVYEPRENRPVASDAAGFALP